MKKVILYHFIFLILLSVATLFLYFCEIQESVRRYVLPLTCILLGGYGGVLYCLRGVYLNASVKGQWSSQWEPWHYVRPVVSLMCGGISYIFLRAGLLVLEAESRDGASDLGFMAFSFIAGLNVDKFVGKIEEIAQASWGIEKSRTTRTERNGDKNI